MKRQSRGPDVSFFAFQDIITAVVGIFILITIILVLELLQRVEAVASAPSADAQQLQMTLQQLQSEVERMEAEYTKRLEQRQSQADTNAFNRAARSEAVSEQIEAATERLAAAEKQLAESRVQSQAAKASETVLLNKLASQQQDNQQLAALEDQKTAIETMTNTFAALKGLLYRDKTDEGRFLCLITLKTSRIEVQDAATKSTRAWSGRSRVDDLQNWLSDHAGSSRHFLLLVTPQGADDFADVRDLLEDAGGVFGYDVIGAQDLIKLRFEMESAP